MNGPVPDRRAPDASPSGARLSGAIVSQALAAHCPRCGNAPLFDGMVRFAGRCRACGLDFGAYNVGDGPAAFLILIVGGLVTFLAVLLQIGASPPFWVHVLLWVPLTTVAVIGCLRVSKAALLILEYRHQAREGRRTDGQGDMP